MPFKTHMNLGMPSPYTTIYESLNFHSSLEDPHQYMNFDLKFFTNTLLHIDMVTSRHNFFNSIDPTTNIGTWGWTSPTTSAHTSLTRLVVENTNSQRRHLQQRRHYVLNIQLPFMSSIANTTGRVYVIIWGRKTILLSYTNFAPHHQEKRPKKIK